MSQLHQIQAFETPRLMVNKVEMHFTCLHAEYPEQVTIPPPG